MDGLKPLVAEKYGQLASACSNIGITIRITSGYRSFSSQDSLYAQGRTVDGEVVTNARGGQSMHNYGVAFDVCPIGTDGLFQWDADQSVWNSMENEGKKLGLTWGGDWTSFADKPHFELTFDYDLADFQNNSIDWSRYGVGKFVFNNDMRYGQSSNDISELQMRLSSLGFFTYPEITGFYGSITAQSVLNFQLEFQIIPAWQKIAYSGSLSRVGPATRAKLNTL